MHGAGRRKLHAFSNYLDPFWNFGGFFHGPAPRCCNWLESVSFAARHTSVVFPKARGTERRRGDGQKVNITGIRHRGHLPLYNSRSPYRRASAISPARTWPFSCHKSPPLVLGRVPRLVRSLLVASHLLDSLLPSPLPSPPCYGDKCQICTIAEIRSQCKGWGLTLRGWGS